MRSQILTDFFNERNSLLLRYLQKINSKEIEESIHHLRVEIKKIHFLFSYAEYFNHHAPFKSLYRPYRSVFKRTGAIRELQLLQQLIENFFTDDRLKKKLEVLHKKEKKRTGKLIVGINKDSRLIAAAAKEVNALFPKFPSMHRDEYLLWLAIIVRKEFKTINAVKLHASRKTLKAVIYSYHLFPSAGVFRNFLNAPAADQLQDLIGAWHDKVVLLAWMGKNLKQKKYETQLSELKKAADADFKQIRQVSKSLVKS